MAHDQKNTKKSGPAIFLNAFYLGKYLACVEGAEAAASPPPRPASVVDPSGSAAPRAVLAPEAGTDSGASWRPAVGGWVVRDANGLYNMVPKRAQALVAIVLFLCYARDRCKQVRVCGSSLERT